MNMFDNEYLDSIVKAAVIKYGKLGTIKVLGDLENREGVLVSFLLNCYSTVYFLDSGCEEVEEYYLRNDDFLFYYYKINSAQVLLLFESDLSFEEVNNVKVMLKTYISAVEDKDK